MVKKNNPPAEQLTLEGLGPDDIERLDYVAVR
jgi:hypothetical protein